MLASPLLNQADRALEYEPRGAARELWLRPEPEVVLCGPAGTGKSLAGLHYIHNCLLAFPGARALFCRKRLTDLTSTGLVTYRDIVRPDLVGVRYFGGSSQEPAQFRYPKDSKLIVGGLDKPTKTLSAEYDIVFVQQLEELTEPEWELLLRALRWNHMPKQQLLGDCNPDAPGHWLKKRADAGKCLMLESRHEDNPLLWNAERSEWTAFGVGYIARLDRMTGARKQRLRYGRWAAAEGAVYEEFDRSLHIIDTLPKMRYHIGAVDWGFTNPGVMAVYGVDGDNRMYLVEEVYQTRQLVDPWWAAQGQRLQKKYAVRRWVADPSEPAYITTLQRARLPVEPAFNAIAPGVEAVQARLKPAPDGRPRLFFARDALASRDDELDTAGKPLCTTQEVDVYVWPRDIAGKPLKEVPVDEDNHGLDALRYAVAYVDQLGKRRLTGDRTAAGPPRDVSRYVPR